MCTQYVETLVFPSGDICLDACYGCRNVFFGLWKRTDSLGSSCVCFFFSHELIFFPLAVPDQ